MNASSIPSVLPIKTPFAVKGQEAQFCDVASFSNGFEAAFSQKPGQQGGYKYISRPLVNKLLGQISYGPFLGQIGSIETFDPRVCEAIGGYPQDAILKWLSPYGLADVRSLVDNNKVDFRDNGPDNVSWELFGSSAFMFMFPDYGTKNLLKTWSMAASGSTISEVAEDDGRTYYEQLAKTSSSGKTVTDEIIVPKTGWLLQTATLPSNLASTAFFEAACVYYRKEAPETVADIGDFWDTGYTWLEIVQIASYLFPIVPVVAGTHVTAAWQSVKNVNVGESTDYACPESFDISVYMISPAR